MSDQHEAEVVLEAVDGPLAGRSLQFREHDTFIFGREVDCHWRLHASDGTASRHHFILEVSPPDAQIRDLGSMNGTRVNGLLVGARSPGETPAEGAQRAFPTTPLADGDLIQVGVSKFRVRMHHPEPRAATTLASGRADPTRPAVEPGAQRPAVPPALSIAGYSIRRKLGQGGMGVVYEAERSQDGRRVALKVLLPKVAVSEHARRLFGREMEVTQTLVHENIVRFFDHGGTGDTLYFAMEYCPGGSVWERLSAVPGGLSLAESLRIMLDVLDGLAVAHQRGFVHRDIKPHNILLMDGPAPRAKLSDFGLAKSFARAGLSGMSVTGQFAGTQLFMPREQLTRYKYVRPESDVYAAGATLYYMLTGQPTRRISPGQDPIAAILRGGSVPIRERVPSLPVPLAQVIDRAVADAPEDRHRDAAELRAALAGARG